MTDIEGESRPARSSEILYEGKSTRKDVDAPQWSIKSQKQVTPFLAIEKYGDDIFQMGVGIRMKDLEGNPENDTARIWQVASPQDIISFWRATRIIDELPTIDNSTLSSTFHAARRKPHSSDLEDRDAVVSQIGQDTFDRIMNEPIPETIIDHILALAEKNQRPTLESVTNEVEAGTIGWRNEFAQIGIKHPDEVKKNEEAADAIIARYSTHLEAFAESEGLRRGSRKTENIESALVTAIGLGIETQHGEDVTFGAALVVGDAYNRSFVQMMMPLVLTPSLSKEEHQARFDGETQAKIVVTAKWLSMRFSRRGGITQRFRNIPHRSEPEYIQLLKRIELEWPKGDEVDSEEAAVVTA